MATNYGELKSECAQYLNRSELDIGDLRFNIANASAARELTARLRHWTNTEVLVMTEASRFSTASPQYLLNAESSEDVYLIEQIRVGSNFSGISLLEEADFSFPLTATKTTVARDNGFGGVTTPTKYQVDPSLETITFNSVPPVDTEFVIYYWYYIFPMTADSDTNLILSGRTELYIFLMIEQLAIMFNDIEMSRLYRESFELSLETSNTAFISARNEGPADIQGASTWV